MSPRFHRLFRLPWRSARQIREDVDAELAFHVEMRTAELVRDGHPADDARAIAVREFGDVEDARQFIRAVDGDAERARRRTDVLRDLRQDLRYAARGLRSAPGFTFAVVLTLALGIGATTAIYSIVNAVLLRPLPFPQSDQIVRLYQVDGAGKRNSVSQPNFADWSAGTHTFAHLALWGSTASSTMQTPSGPVTARISTVTHDFFAVLGVRPALGRLFAADETRFGGRRTAIISDRFWRDRFGADPAVIGQRLFQGSDGYEIVGVLPAAATFPADNDVWLPLELFPPVLERTAQGYSVVARVKPGVPLEVARQDVSALSRRLKEEYGNRTNMSDAMVVGLREQLVGDVRPRILMLLAASAFLLAIGLANALNLLMARMALRQSELAVRVALGATRWRLTRQLLVESASLVSIASAFGLLIAIVSVRAVVRAAASSIPRAGEVSVDWSVLAFTVVLSVVLALAMGLLAPALGARRELRDGLSSSPRGATGAGATARLRRGMVVLQLALTVILLVGSVLLGRGFLRLLDVRPGFATERVLVANASPASDDKFVRLAYYDALLEKARALPGVIAVGAASAVPIAGGGPDADYLLLDSPGQRVTFDDWRSFSPSRKGRAEFRIVAGDYFKAMGIPLVEGRLFELRDGADAASVAVVSALFAAQAWPNEDPIGRVVEYGNMDGDLRPYTVVGVVGDVRHENLAAQPTPTFYGLLVQRPNAAQTMTLVLRTSRDPETIIPPLRAAVHDLRPDVPLRARAMDQVIAASVADRRFILLIVTAFGGAALVLATLGVYSLVSYLVAQRTREIGVRIALGAQRGDVMALIVGEALRLTLAGVAIGIGCSLVLTRIARGLLYGVSPTDPVAFLAVAVVLTATALVAAYVPGRRAMHVDPISVLRSA